MKTTSVTIALILLFAACKKSEIIVPLPLVVPVAPVIASLNTSIVTALAITTATSGGNITADGGSPITARGICYGISANPTIANKTVSGGTGKGSFSVNISGLKANTVYYLRAFATNTAGTAYGKQVSFTTLYPGTVKDADNNVYHTIKIGNQVWMSENLKTGKYRDGTAISFITDSYDWAHTTSGAYCNYDNELSNDATYGKLYNWAASNNTHQLAPVGWHIPTDADWDELIKKLGGAPVAGGSLKENTFNFWASPNAGANNSSGFRGLPGGFRDKDYSIWSLYHFYDRSKTGSWWSATGVNSYSAGCLRLSSDDAIAYRDQKAKSYGFSIRCVMDK